MNTLLLHPSETMKALEGHRIDLNLTSQPRYHRLPDVGVVVGAPEIWVDDEDRSMDEEFCYAIEELRPSLFVLETVRGLAGPRYEGFLHDLVDDLTDLGYVVGHEVIKIEGRKRLLIVGRRNGKMPILRTRNNTIASIIEANLEDA